MDEIQEELLHVDIEKICVNPHQPRKHFEPTELEELAQSIRSVGLLHPPLVRLISSTDQYELISGERRYRAARLAGMAIIPVVVRTTTQSVSAEAALIENVQRVDLNPLEIAHSLESLMKEFGYHQDEMALKIGKKRSTISNYLRLLTLPPHIQNGISKNKITMGHAKAILSLDSIEKQNLLYEMVLRDDMNVREAEEAAVRIGNKAKKQLLTYVTRDFYLDQIAEKIQHKLGTKVSIQGKGKRGRISIDYYNLDDLDRLLELFGVNEQ